MAQQQATQSDYRPLDLRGEVCPYTFVKSKLALEEMGVGELLEIIVDFRPAASNIPKSMEMEGQEVVEVKQEASGTWSILVRKLRD